MNHMKIEVIGFFIQDQVSFDKHADTVLLSF